MSILKQSIWKRFHRDERGNIAVMFAMCLLPLLGLVGSAIDYSRATMIRERLQSAIDATALKLTRDGAKLSDSDLQKMATRYFAALFDASDISSAPALTVKRTDQTVTLSADANLPAVFMPLLGIDKIDVGANAVSTYDQSKIELALVLDNTGSMGEMGKMAALKDALANPKTGLIKQISDMNAVADRIKVAIVPFDTQVNVGTSYQWKDNKKYYHAAWLGFNDAGKHFVASRNLLGAADPQTLWTGCVADRYTPYDTGMNDPDSPVPDTLYPASTCASIVNKKATLGAILPLTSSQSDMLQSVNAMQPSGTTNVAIGFHWGMRMLESQTVMKPLSLGVPMGTLGVKKFIVLLTDGDNTANRFNEASYRIDDRTQTMCNAIKAGGDVTIYTVRVIAGNEALLKGCASAAANYYNVNDASGIAGAFQSILDSITGIRLAS